MLSEAVDVETFKKKEELTPSNGISVEIIKTEDEKKEIEGGEESNSNGDGEEDGDGEINANAKANTSKVYTLSSLKELLNDREELNKHLNELKRCSIDSINQENKKFMEYFQEKYDMNVYGENIRELELQNLKKGKCNYMNSTESIEDYNRQLMSVSHSYDERKAKEKEENEKKFHALSHGVCNESPLDDIDPKDYLKKNVFTVLMPGIEELLSNVKKSEDGVGKEVKNPIQWLANYLKENNPNKNKPTTSE